MAKLLRIAALTVIAAACAAPARAQFTAFSSVTAVSSPTAVVPGLELGVKVPLERGPWVLGEILFFSAGRMVNDFTWRDTVRGTRGSLYNKGDVDADKENLMKLNKFDKVDAGLYEIPGTPVPPEFAAIAASTAEVRLVFFMSEKAVQVSSAPVRRILPPAAVSGVILTPTAYRGAGKYTTPGLGLDFNLLYVIGRLYGKNNYANSSAKTNYLDRVGIWMLTADGKMQLQSEGRIRPAVAVGGQGAFLFRDTPQPNVNDPNPTVTVNATQKKTKLLSDAYFVVSKKFGPARTSLGVMEGSMGSAVAQFSEFLTPDGLRFFSNCTADATGGGLNCQSGNVTSHTMPFASVMFRPKPQYPLSIEYIKFDGAALHPWMVNLKIGYFLHLNFDVGILKFDGGWDALGLLEFRYNQFPNK